MINSSASKGGGTKVIGLQNESSSTKQKTIDRIQPQQEIINQPKLNIIQQQNQNNLRIANGISKEGNSLYKENGQGEQPGRKKLELIIDRQEYQQVFKVIDKNNTGEINIQQVYDLLEKFDNQVIINPINGIRNPTSSVKSGQFGAQSKQQNQGVGASNFSNNSVLYSNGQQILGGKDYKKFQNGQESYNHARNNKPANQANNNNNQNSPNRRSINGTSGNNLLQLRPTANVGNSLVSQQQTTKSPRRQSNLQNAGTALNIKLNQMGGEDEPKKRKQLEFSNGKETIQFDEFIDMVRESSQDEALAENYLVLAFSMFDRQKKGYINSQDLKEVFAMLGENINEEEVVTMIKIAGVKSADKINFKEFVDFFYKID